MRVDRGGAKGFINESSRSGKDASVQKKDGKNQHKSSQLNDSDPVPAESKVDAGVVAGRKEESELTAKITRRFLSAELPDSSSPEQSAPIHSSVQEFPDLTNAGSILTESKSTKIEKSLAPEVEISENPLTPSTAEQKAAVVQKLLDQPSSSQSGEIITSVLVSADNADEFNRIVDHAGGKEIVSTFESGEMKIFWDRLAGAYGRNDLAMIPDEAATTQSILIGEQPQLQVLLPQSTEPLLLQTILENGPINLNTLSRNSAVCTVLENAVRVQDGSPFVIPRELREKVFDILNTPDQPVEKRASVLESLRIEAGLTEFQMREIVSLPMAGLFQSAIADLTAFRDNTVISFEKQIERAIVTYGPESVAVEIAKAEQTEFIDKIEPEINLFRDLHVTASEIFSGPADPLVKIDSAVHLLLNDFVPSTAKLETMVEKLQQGAQIFESGKLDATLQRIDGLQIPELKSFVAGGTAFFSHLSKLIPDIQILVPELKPFQFLDHLHNGLFRQQLSEFGQAMEQFRQLPSIQQSVTELDQWRKEFGRLKSMPDRQGAGQAGEKILEQLTGEILPGRWSALNQEVQRSDLSSRLDGIIESVRTMGDLVVSFRNGHFVQVLSALNHRMAGSPAILQIIQQALHLANSGAGFFRSLFNREWEKPFAVALKKNPGNKELTEAQSFFSDALNLFLPLQSIDYLNPFLQYQKQLGIFRDQTLMNDRIHRHQA